MIRERHQLAREIAHLATLTPVSPTAPVAPRAPTPLDVRRTAVTQAVHRAARAPQTAADLRVMAARSHLATSTQNRSSNPTPALGAPPASPPAPRRSR